MSCFAVITDYPRCLATFATKDEADSYIMAVEVAYNAYLLKLHEYNQRYIDEFEFPVNRSVPSWNKFLKSYGLSRHSYVTPEDFKHYLRCNLLYIAHKLPNYNPPQYRPYIEYHVVELQDCCCSRRTECLVSS